MKRNGTLAELMPSRRRRTEQRLDDMYAELVENIPGTATSFATTSIRQVMGIATQELYSRTKHDNVINTKISVAINRNMLNGITSAFGMSKETASKEPKVGAMSVAQAASYIRSMDVKVNKAHVLTPQKRRALWMCMYGAVLAGCLAGVGAAFLAHALNSITSGIVDEEEDYVAWNVISAAFSLIWSMAEMVVCCIAALVAAVRMTRICGINLVPMDKERAMLAGSLARCALELGHPSVRTFGINPYKRVNKYLLLVYALIYMGSRGITKFFIKLLVKKVAPRTFVKAADMAPLVIEVLINVLFNFITVRYAMSEVMICSIGPSATVEVTSQLIKAHRQTSDVEEPLSDRVKLLALRAVGVSITYKMQMHPNSRVLLNYVVELFADEKFVKRAKEEYGDMLARHGLKPGKSSRSLGAKSQVTYISEVSHRTVTEAARPSPSLFIVASPTTVCDTRKPNEPGKDGRGATAEELKHAEEKLDYKLPESFKQLLQFRRGGGEVARACFAATGTSWAKDHVHIGELMGFNDDEEDMSILGTSFWIDEWEYPAIGVACCMCPSGGHDLIWLDYSKCGRQGEPRVVHVDQEFDMKITHLADDFASFVRGLKTEEEFESSDLPAEKRARGADDEEGDGPDEGEEEEEEEEVEKLVTASTGVSFFDLRQGDIQFQELLVGYRNGRALRKVYLCFCEMRSQVHWRSRWSSPEAPTESLHEELADLGLDDEDMFFNGLSELNRRDALFACSLLVLALMINGRIDRTNWAFIQRASRSVEPPLEAKWSNVLHLVNAYVGGRSMNADMFHAVFQPSMTQSSSATCCDYLREGWRYVLDYTNCC
ncbi:unnamed protein product [Symbiodinium microadriaticum]|nr:unnamed protein product [Symbiodinium microadriaticum]